MNSNMVCVLVDDDTDDRDIFEMALKDAAKDVKLVEATGAEQALELFNDNSFVPSYIFLDLNMPRMSGTECLVELRKRSHLQKVPIIIYSTSSADRDRAAAVSAGAQHFFTKPASVRNLADALRDIISTPRQAVI
jgi:DNA-binding response OmpR family regulator